METGKALAQLTSCLLSSVLGDWSRHLFLHQQGPQVACLGPICPRSRRTSSHRLPSDVNRPIVSDPQSQGNRRDGRLIRDLI